MPCQGPYGSYDYGTDHKKNYLACERELCEARWLLLKVVELARVPGDLQEAVEAQREAQLAHRKGDQTQALEHIRDTIRRVKRDIREIEKLGGTPGPKLADQLVLLLEKQEEIRGMSDADLLANYWGTEYRLDEEVDH